ncbi:MAG: di-trans,poly-cis-decaprenylcistransferase, partial [Candidatus Hydrothermae bacterium]|nr:di-trans,poly-cis-decaprenylcistransferase [Candidatus Hydrothermae bacterium]
MKNKLPVHVAIIMDGNGRWAKERGLPRIIGHKVGAESVREIIRTAKEIGIKYLTLFTFSTENWRRPEEEVNFLMDMLKQLLRDEVEDLKRNGVRLRAMGRLDMLPRRVREELEYAERETEMNKDLTVILALSYSGRAEIVDAMK